VNLPGTKRLRLEYDGLLSSFGFKFNLRRCTMLAESMLLPANLSTATAPHAAAAGGSAKDESSMLDSLWECLGEAGEMRVSSPRQGLALVHSTAQPEPFLTQNTP